MRVLMLEAPESLLQERRRKGLDRFDEVWEGVLHMVPSPSSWHQEFDAELIMALGPIAKARGLRVSPETSLYVSDDDYRTPDIVFTRRAHRTRRGVEGGAELVVEILSPGDES